VNALIRWWGTDIDCGNLQVLEKKKAALLYFLRTYIFTKLLEFAKITE